MLCWRWSALILDREQFLRSYLYAFLFWTGMALGCMGILLLHHTVGGKWGMVIRRMCEAGARTLPYMFIFLIPDSGEPAYAYTYGRGRKRRTTPIIQLKTAYLNVPFMIGRAVFYFLVWTFYAYRLSELVRASRMRAAIRT